MCCALEVRSLKPLIRDFGKGLLNLNMSNEHWDNFEEKHNPGDLIKGVITTHANYGLFVDLGHEPLLGFIPVPNIFDEPVHRYWEHYPPIGRRITARIKGFRRDNNQVYLSIKPSDLQ